MQSIAKEGIASLSALAMYLLGRGVAASLGVGAPDHFRREAENALLDLCPSDLSLGQALVDAKRALDYSAQRLAEDKKEVSRAIHQQAMNEVEWAVASIAEKYQLIRENNDWRYGITPDIFHIPENRNSKEAAEHYKAAESEYNKAKEGWWSLIFQESLNIVLAHQYKNDDNYKTGVEDKACVERWYAEQEGAIEGYSEEEDEEADSGLSM